MSQAINFDVNTDLFKGHLLVKYQIEESSRSKGLVLQTEEYFLRWMNQIKVVLVQGRKVVEHRAEVGPRYELDRWRRNYSFFTSALEFIDSRPFKNHLKCLTLSRSKLAKVIENQLHLLFAFTTSSLRQQKWCDVHTDLIAAFNEAQDNVMYLTSLEQFYEPLYDNDPVEMIKHLPLLMKALRNVYNSSKFYNTSECVATFLVKCTNQLIIVCRSFITENNSKSVFNHTPEKLDEKIQVCR